jgi:hypothetical protein
MACWAVILLAINDMNELKKWGYKPDFSDKQMHLVESQEFINSEPKDKVKEKAPDDDQSGAAALELPKNPLGDSSFNPNYKTPKPGEKGYFKARIELSQAEDDK